MRAIIFIFTSAVFLLGCSTSNPDYCASAEDCQGEVNVFCDIEGVFAESGLTNTCVPMPMGDPCNEVEQGKCTADQVCLPVAGGGLLNECVDCVVDADCGSPGRTCADDNTCTAASCVRGDDGNTACAALDTDFPICGLNSTCVECDASSQCQVTASTTNEPVCDMDTGLCRACSENFECLSGICDVQPEGATCVPANTIVYVDDGGSDDEPCGSFDQTACKTINHGLTKLMGAKTTLLVRMGNYDEEVIINDKQGRIVGEDGAVVAPNPFNDNDIAVQVSGDSQIVIENLDIIPNGLGGEGSIGLDCVGGSNPTLAFEGGTIGPTAGTGVTVDRCGLTLLASTVTGHARGGIDILDSDFRLENNFIVNNGSDGSSGSFKGGVTLTGTARKDEIFDFNTLFGNGSRSATGAGGSVTCSGTGLTASSNIIHSDGQGSGAGIISNLGGTCDFNYSLIVDTNNSPTVPYTGTSNIVGDPDFEDAGGGDYRIKMTSPCFDKADPLATLTTDFEGQARPSPDGGLRDCGADEYHPPAS